MTIQYDILLQLSVLHDFYDGGIDPGIQIVPTPATKQLLNNYRMITRVNQGKLQIAAEVNATDDGVTLQEHLQSPFEMVFTLQFRDAYWVNYTAQLPDEGKKYFFTNRNHSEEDDHTNLHAELRVSESDQIKMLSNTTLTYPNETEVTLVRKGLKEEDRSAAIKTVQNKKYINTQNLEEGLYEINENGNATTVFITGAENMHGIFHLLVDPSSNDFAPVLDENWTLQSPDFTAHFKNRSTRWCYYFTKSNLEHLEGLQITNGTEETYFGKPEDTMGPNGKSMIRIASNEPLEITSKPTQHLQLKKNMNIENRSEGVVIDRLPVPNKENLYRVGKDGSILTDLFINL
ncbi:MAG: hypothetical protein Crog4KO_23520 [Crocinitomicaceae bacterium]